MSYNWEKIFKRKTEMELYKIYSGETQLDLEAIKFAKKELDYRKFEFNNIDEFKKQWNIRTKLEEENEKHERLRYGIKDSLIYYSLMFSGFTTIFLVLMDFRFEYDSLFSNDSESQFFLLYIALGLLLIASGIVGFRRNQNRKKKRNKRQ